MAKPSCKVLLAAQAMFSPAPPWLKLAWACSAWAALLGTGLFGAALTRAEDDQQPLANWHQWRGPLADGTAPQADPPLRWDEKTNVRWKFKIPGEGKSTPIVWGRQVFLLAATKTDRAAEEPPQADERSKTEPPAHYYRFSVICIDRTTGKLLWQTAACQQVPHEGRHYTNTYASYSPTTDGRRLYVSFGSRGVYCYKLDGELLWQRDLGRMRTRYGWGEGASPVVHGDFLVINWDHEDQSFIAALDANTGELRWKTERDEPSSWATPLIAEYDGRTQVIVNGTNRVRSYDLADGKLIWECGGQSVNAIPSPIRVDDFVICMSGYRSSLAVAIPLNSRGDVSDSEQLRWRHSRGTPYVPSPLAVQGRLYFTQSNTSVLTCLNLRTGELVFGPQRISGLGNLYASPVAAGGRIYFVGRDGEAVVMKASSQLDILATNKLDDTFDASPALVGNQILLRGAQFLYCLEKSPSE